MTASGSRSSGMWSFFAVLWNSKVEHCAGRLLDYGPESAPMGLKNGPANGESHAHPAGLSRVERIKDLVYSVGGDTSSRVFNCCLHTVWINILGHDDKLSEPITNAAHRFHRIHHQVEHDLLQLNSVSCNRWKAIIKL